MATHFENSVAVLGITPQRPERPDATPTPILPQHSLDHPGVVKIALGQSASDALAALGDFQLVLVSKADCTAPQSTQGRRILHCLPITKQLADDLFRVASGTHRAAKIKAPKPSTAAPLSPAEIRKA